VPKGRPRPGFGGVATAAREVSVQPDAPVVRDSLY